MTLNTLAVVLSLLVFSKQLLHHSGNTSHTNFESKNVIIKLHLPFEDNTSFRIANLLMFFIKTRYSRANEERFMRTAFV